MNDKRATAITNNLALYQAVLVSHDLELKRADDIYYLEKQAPPLYSNLVTRVNSWSPDSIFRTIDHNFEVENWNEWSIKDSFQCLDLVPFGFEKLFNSQWLYLNPENFLKLDSSTQINFRIVANRRDLSVWIETWGEDVELGERIYNEKLLANPNIHFVIGYLDEVPVYVALLNQSEPSVVGISNFFVQKETSIVWTELISFILGKFGKVNIVGYEDNKTTSALSVLGVECVGDLSVWHKKK